MTKKSWIINNKVLTNNIPLDIIDPETNERGTKMATKKQLVEKAFPLLKEYEKLSSRLWDEIQKGNVHGHRVDLMVGSSKGYNALRNLTLGDDYIVKKVINKLKKAELEQYIEEIEGNIKKIKELIREV